ncbi:MAG: alpha-2-macroglobulin family protein [Kofleriaceae bacterium]
MRLSLAYLIVCVLAGGGCGGGKEDKPGGSPNQPGSAGSGDSPEPVDSPPKHIALTPEKLAPVFGLPGQDGVVPPRIAIELATPVIDEDERYSAGQTNEFKLTPELPGRLSYSSVSGLSFFPTRPFEFDTAYTLEIKKLATRDGALAPPAGTKWAVSFKTPSFRLFGWAPTRIDLANHRATMELRFSGLVHPNLARNALKFTVDGKPVAGVQVLTSASYGGLAVQLTDPAIKAGARLAFSLANLESASGARLASGSGEHVLTDVRPVAIGEAVVEEGANGFFISVRCTDQAAEPAVPEPEYYGPPRRCQLTDDAVSKIHFEPEVKKVYLTSGSGGFRIFGDFKRGAYKMKIDAGATTVDGGTVLAASAQQLVVRARKAQLGFAASGRYLPRTAWNNLGIKHANVEAVNLIVRQVPPENLVFWLGGADAADDRTSNVILKKTIPLRGDVDALSTTWLDVASLVPASMNQGVLELKLVGLGVHATSRLMLTNLSLVAKKTATPGKPWEQQVTAWALGMDSTELLDGVEISLVRRSGKVVARCTTTGAAGCSLAVRPDGDPDQAEPFALIARKGDDLTYIRYQDVRATVSESSTSGQPYVAEAPYRASVFADRGVYRPGETAHVVAIVRDAKDRAPEQPLPVDVKLIDPRAKVVRKLTLTSNAGGVVAFEHVLPAFADTGHWQVQLQVADKPLASYGLLVEEFVPERMEVTATPAARDLQLGSAVSIDVAARYLFGGSAFDSGVELTCKVQPVQFAPKENADLTYGVAPKGKPVELGASRGQLDPAGKLAIACPAATTAFKQTSTLTATAAVLEAGSGRTSMKSTSLTLHPEAFYLGVRSKATRAVAGEPFTIEGMVVDWTGKLAASAAQEVQVELLQLEADYGYGYDEETGESRYDRHLRRIPDGKQQAKVSGGKFSFTVSPGAAPAGYVVRVTAGKAMTELVLDGEYPYDYYNYGDGDQVDSTPRPSRPTQLVLDAPEQISVGAATQVKVKTPYRGKLLWTVETDKLIRSEWKAVTGAESTWSFTLDQFAPNVYVSAFLIKDPHLESKDAFMPDRAFGIQSIRVAPTTFTTQVAIDVPKQIRSSSPLVVKLDVGKPAGPTFATVAVVDEGILSLTGFKTPDPLAQLFSKRALGVETYETIGWTMLHQPAGASSRTGGGDDMESEADGGALDPGRVQPVKPVALFSGVVQVGPDGKAAIPFEIPSYRGQLRVMAITASATQVGRAEAKVTVRDPLVVQVTFPRFVTQNDQLQIPVFLTNVSGGPLDVSLALASEHLAIPGLAQPAGAIAPLKLAKDTGAVKLADGRSETLVFQATGAIPAGGAKLRVVAKARGSAGAFEVADEVEVPFLPAGPRERAIQKIKVEPGKLDLLAKATTLGGWVPTSETTTFWLTSNPYGEAFEHLSYLIHYPYGCIEQTTSTARPLLYVGGLVEQLDPELGQGKVEEMVLSGINRILSMETPSGGFGYWPGATQPLEWATAYATHFLLDAKKQGYAVPDDRLKDVLAWIEGRVTQYERGARIQRDRWNHYDEQAEAYLHYVLAAAGKGRKGRILDLIRGIPAGAKGELAEGRYMLQAALYLAGDRRYEKDLKAVDASPIADERINSWSFYSDRRRRGFMLSTFFDLFGTDAAGEPLAQRVASSLVGQPSGYYNTQELVWGVTGLGKWVKASTPARATAAGTLIGDGATISPRKSRTQSADQSWVVRRASEYKALSIDVPASSAGMWLVIRSEGVRAGGDYKVGGNGLAVRRTYRNLEGQPVDPATDTIQLGDLLFVEVEVGNTTGEGIQNIAVVDRLPAGFEIENPKLGRTTKADWVVEAEQWQLDFMNLRDDRLQAFGALPPKATKKIVYTVRAVTSGTFAIPPVEAEAMYDASLWARQKGGTAVVGGPWTGKTL